MDQYKDVIIVNIDELDAKTHARYGWVYLTSSSNFTGMSTGQSPTGTYVGILFEADTVISAFTSNDNGKNQISRADATFGATKSGGFYLPWPGLTGITISSGSCYLVKGKL